MLNVGRLAGVKVMQLVNTNTAVALNYGVFRRTEFNETAQHIMFYDMGATGTTASIVAYKTTKEKGVSKPVPGLEVLAVGYDRQLGGVDWDFRLRDHLLEQFKKNPKVG